MTKVFYLSKSYGRFESSLNKFFTGYIHPLIILILCNSFVFLQLKFQPYWPNGGNLKFDPVIVEKGSETKYEDFICREFKVTHTQVS